MRKMRSFLVIIASIIAIALLLTLPSSSSIASTPTLVTIKGTISPSNATVGSGFILVNANNGFYSFSVYAMHKVNVYAFAHGYYAYSQWYNVTGPVIWANITLQAMNISNMQNFTFVNSHFIELVNYKNYVNMPCFNQSVALKSINTLLSYNLSWENKSIKIMGIVKGLNNFIINTNKSINIPVLITFIHLIINKQYMIKIITNASIQYYNFTANSTQYNFVYSNFTVDPQFTLLNISSNVTGIGGILNSQYYNTPLWLWLILILFIIMAIAYVYHTKRHHHKRRRYR
jgi:hypothetical protein